MGAPCIFLSVKQDHSNPNLPAQSGGVCRKLGDCALEVACSMHFAHLSLLPSSHLHWDHWEPAQLNVTISQQGKQDLERVCFVSGQGAEDGARKQTLGFGSRWSFLESSYSAQGLLPHTFVFPLIFWGLA